MQRFGGVAGAGVSMEHRRHCALGERLLVMEAESMERRIKVPIKFFIENLEGVHKSVLFIMGCECSKCLTCKGLIMAAECRIDLALACLKEVPTRENE